MGVLSDARQWQGLVRYVIEDKMEEGINKVEHYRAKQIEERRSENDAKSTIRNKLKRRYGHDERKHFSVVRK